jgi:ATP-dependent exoDNAse (exonuclease V) alpha subunit
MLGTRDLARLLAHVHTARGKLVLVGDPKQLPSIDAAGLFPLLVEHLDAITLTSNRRQIDPADRAALSAFRNDEIDTALDSYRTRGRLHTYADAGAQRAAMVTAWWTDRESGIESVMLAYRRADIRELNQLARIRMSVAGILTGPECAVSVGHQHTTGFRAGDKVLLRRNHYPLQIHNGDRGVVAHVDPEAGTVTVQIDRTNATVTLPRRYLDTGGLDHGYAVTIHASQGITVSRSHVLGNDALFFEAGLVALSRHRDTCHLHVTEGIDVDERTDLERTHSQRQAQDDASTLSRRLSISRADDAAISYTR